MGYAKVLVGVLLFITLATTSTAFTCTNTTTTTTNSTCRSLVGYVSPNTTALSSIQSLFQIKLFDDLLGANSFNASTSPKQTIQANHTIKIPITCRCANGTGVPDSPPVYTVIKDDGLFHIAAEIFSRLVTYQEIAAFNNIPDVNNITVGQQVRIPLPCSCDEVDGVPVVHYAHVVQPGSSVDQIATEFGTTPDILLKLNGMTNATDLQAYQVLDVPLKVVPTASPTASPGSDASKTGMQGFRWNFLLISIQLIFLCFTLS